MFTIRDEKSNTVTVSIVGPDIKLTPPYQRMTGEVIEYLTTERNDIASPLMLKYVAIMRSVFPKQHQANLDQVEKAHKAVG